MSGDRQGRIESDRIELNGHCVASVEREISLLSHPQQQKARNDHHVRLDSVADRVRRSEYRQVSRDPATGLQLSLSGV